jgi:hypothetical protein
MKPSDFFLGVMEFFAVLVPGALLTFLLTPWASSVFGVVLPSLVGEPMHWAAFLVCSYFFGNLLHHIGSFLDLFYDHVYVKLKRRKGEEELLKKAKELMQEDLKPELKKLSAFSWASSWVKARNVAAGTELERSGAESKFFRSLCLVATVAAVSFATKEHQVATIVSLALAVFSLLRFCKRRWDTSQLAYEYFVMLRLFPSKEFVLHGPQT